MLILLLLSIRIYAQQGERITIQVTNIPNDQGQLIISLHSSQEKFPKKYDYRKFANIQNGKSVSVFEKIPHGEYAVSIVHDENKNGKLDFYFFGMPSEKTAASNNATKFWGPPDWEDAKFYFDGSPIVQMIEM